MLSAAAQTFAQARTPANLTALWKQEPQTAADWLVRYSKNSGVQSEKLSALQQVLQSTFEAPTARDAALLEFLGKNADIVSAMELGALQTARADTLGFTVVTKPVPATLTGTVAVENGLPMLVTADGKFKVDSPNWQGSLQYKYFEANALQAFNGRTVTVRAWPTDTPGLLAVEEFAPGTSPDFVSGRLSIDANGKVGVRVRTDKWVEIRDPELASRIKTMAHDESGMTNGTGVIMPGKVTQEGDKYFFEGKPNDDFWMLSKTLPGQPTTLQVGHGLTRPFTGDVTVPDASGRILVFGHIAEDRSTILAKGALTTPATRFENGVPFKRDASALLTATPVDPTPVEDPRGFGL